jgi:hypothetical protein
MASDVGGLWDDVGCKLTGFADMLGEESFRHPTEILQLLLQACSRQACRNISATQDCSASVIWG